MNITYTITCFEEWKRIKKNKKKHTIRMKLLDAEANKSNVIRSQQRKTIWFSMCQCVKLVDQSTFAVTLFHRTQLTAAVWSAAILLFEAIFPILLAFGVAFDLHCVRMAFFFPFIATNIKWTKLESCALHLLVLVHFIFHQFKSCQKVTWCDSNSTGLRTCLCVCVFMDIEREKTVWEMPTLGIM